MVFFFLANLIPMKREKKRFCIENFTFPIYLGWYGIWRMKATENAARKSRADESVQPARSRPPTVHCWIHHSASNSLYCYFIRHSEVKQEKSRFIIEREKKNRVSYSAFERKTDYHAKLILYFTDEPLPPFQSLDEGQSEPIKANLTCYWNYWHRNRAEYEAKKEPVTKF